MSLPHNYDINVDYEWCPTCLGTGSTEHKQCSNCNGSQSSAYELFNYTPGGKDWNEYYGRTDILVKLPEALDPNNSYKLKG
jgi:hypothetical protein